MTRGRGGKRLATIGLGLALAWGSLASEAKGFSEVERIMRVQKPDFVQINYSLVDRGAAQRILPLAQELRMAVIINRPFGGGGVLKVISAKPLPP